MASRRLFAAAALLASVALSGCMGPYAPKCPSDGGTSCLRILFIGNSYTFVNDLPGTFAKLAESGGHSIEVDTLAGGGASFEDHQKDPETYKRLDAVKWDYVVLQEQSVVPALPESRKWYMYPPARSMVGDIKRRDEKAIFFMTWAHRDGVPEYGIPDYESMQKAMNGGYLEIAGELDVPVVPVGVTWFVVRRQHPEIDLWQGDGSHPSGAGTYLAACDFYAAIYRASPEGLSFDGGLNQDQARTLQHAAADTVLTNPAQWGLS